MTRTNREERASREEKTNRKERPATTMAKSNRKERTTARQSKGKWSIRFERALALHVLIAHPLNFRISRFKVLIVIIDLLVVNWLIDN